MFQASRRFAIGVCLSKVLRSVLMFGLSPLVIHVLSGPALAQGLPLAQWACKTEVQGIRVEGDVYFSLWQTTGITEGNQASLYNRYLMRGWLHLIPGTVNVFGDLRDQNQNIIRFEVALTGHVRGTGAYWINGVRHRESHMDLVLNEGGFDVYPWEGGAFAYACQPAIAGN